MFVECDVECAPPLSAALRVLLSLIQLLRSGSLFSALAKVELHTTGLRAKLVRDIVMKYMITLILDELGPDNF